MKTIERVKFKLYPSELQKSILLKNCRNARYAYNWGVAKIRSALERGETAPSAYTLSAEFNKYKRMPENYWLVEEGTSQRATKMAFCKQLKMAMKKFTKEGKRPPAFKTKKSGEKMSYYTHEKTTLYLSNSVRVENAGYIDCKHNLPISDKDVKIVDPIIMWNGDYFEMAVTIKYNIPQLPKYHYSETNYHSEAIGIDVGITHQITTSDGYVYDVPDISRLEKRIARIDRKIAKNRRMNGTAYETKTKSFECIPKTQNFKKLEAKRRKLYRKSVNIRKDARCKAISDIFSRYPEAIVIEGIKNPREWRIKGAKTYNHKIQNACIGDVLERIKYKSKWLDVPLYIADEDYPSSQICSCCGNRDGNKFTRNRMFKCSRCGYTEDRDINAAKNLSYLANESIRQDLAC